MEWKPRVYVASLDEVKSGESTDIYFKRTRMILEKAGLADKVVRAEIHAYSLPKGYSWAIFAGLEEALWLLEGKNINVYAVPEGTLFRYGYPLMLIEGPYAEFAVYETALLGILRHYTSIATKAARIKRKAGDKIVLFFGLRCLHPILAPMADRAALIGGVDGVSGVLSEKYNGVKPMGTMPHALVLVAGSQEKAWILFDKYVEESVPRIMLVDTLWDEREESLLAAKVLGSKLYGVRLDTPGSRRGSMRRIVEEVRWTLDIHGYGNVKIFVSGGIDENDVEELRDIVDGFGVGTSIAFPPSVDLSMDIVEVLENRVWIPRSKRGKLPGAKQFYRVNVNEDYIVRWGSKPPVEKAKPMLEKVIENGKIVCKQRSLSEIREYVLSQLKELKDAG